MLHKFQKFVYFLSDYFEAIALCAGWGTMILISADVTMYKIFRYPLRGAFDLVSLLMVIQTAFVITAALLRGKHIAIEVFVISLPRSIQRVISAVASIFALGISVVIAWQSFLYARILQTAGELSPTANVPYFPFAYGIGISFVLVSLAFLCQFLESVFSKQLPN
jgi:TRAP-type C4-dicarboxylate transport system permease small subunit